MHQRLRAATAFFVLSLITVAGYVWHYAGGDFGAEQISVSYALLGLSVVSGIWLLGEVVVIILIKYQELTEKEKEKVREITDDCRSVYEGRKSWWEVFRCRL